MYRVHFVQTFILPKVREHNITNSKFRKMLFMIVNIYLLFVYSLVIKPKKKPYQCDFVNSYVIF